MDTMSILTGVVFAVGVLFPDLGWANGMRPGVQITDVPLETTCVDGSGTKHHMLRVLLRVEGEVRTVFVVKLGDATEELPLGRIREAQFRGGVKTSGFRSANVVYADGAKATVLIKVRDPGGLLKLEGASENGGTVSVAVSSCKTLAFEPMAAKDERSNGAATDSTLRKPVTKN